MVDFFEHIWDWFITRPARIKSAGSVCFTAGGILSFAGLWGMIATAAGNVVNQMAKKPLDTSLAAMYPNLPTWWIPESIVSLFLAFLLIAVGIYLTMAGKKLDRLMRFL